jgi:hypothetical protein
VPANAVPREEPGSHILNKTGSWGSWYVSLKNMKNASKMNCAPLSPAAMRSLLERNERVNELVRARKLSAIIPALNRSLGLWDEHLALRTPQVVKKKGFDCTHWCQPSPIIVGVANRFLAAAGALASP